MVDDERESETVQGGIRDLDRGSAGVSTYECAECGVRVEADHQPGECPECGGRLIDLDVSRE